MEGSSRLSKRLSDAVVEISMDGYAYHRVEQMHEDDECQSVNRSTTGSCYSQRKSVRVSTIIMGN